ncbi:tyrosine-type recombinase/integrase [Amycolatopsis sp. NPDC003731]
MEGRIGLEQVGEVRPADGRFPPFVVIGGDGEEIVPVTQYLRSLALSDMSPLTSRSYGHDLLRWFRVLWALQVDWQQATESEADVLVGWMKSAPNPQRRRTRPSADIPGGVNVRTGKPVLASGYARSTINHNLTVVFKFYEFHIHWGRGPVVNPIPSSRERRAALAHRSPIDAPAHARRARLRQRAVQRVPRAIPDALWDELFDAMTCDRDRTLLLMFVSSAARSAELLGVCREDIDWAGQRFYVTSKGTRLREAVPTSAEALRMLARYLSTEDGCAPGEVIWRTRRGLSRPLSYWAMRRILQRANDKLGTNWTWHDMRHTAATRMVNDPALELHEVQVILRHANIATTGIYTTVTVEDLHDRLQEHYARPRPERTFTTGYAAEDIAVVFGG